MPTTPMIYSPWFRLENDRYIIEHRQVGYRSLAGIQWIEREIRAVDKEKQIYDEFSVEFDEGFSIEDGIAAIEE